MKIAWVAALLMAASPYVRSRVRPGSVGDPCLYWPEDSKITWRANQEGNPETPDETEFDAFRAAFGSWNQVLGSCASVSFVEGARTASHEVGWKGQASEISKNENVVLFRHQKCSDVVPSSDSCWARDNDTDDCGNKYNCWNYSAGIIALTTTTYDPNSGQVFDADIEINDAEPKFVHSAVKEPPCLPTNVSTACVAYDIQNTMTHEIGHVLGLDHTDYPGSTMNPTAPLGETTKRNIDTGTASFVCDVYPKGSPARACVIRPLKQDLGSVAPVGCACSSNLGLGAALAALALLKRRNRK